MNVEFNYCADDSVDCFYKYYYFEVSLFKIFNNILNNYFTLADVLAP